ncbi:MAG TPA: CotH kinase family protein [Polyangiales bacterium]|nr:CotH kinase family protein [Polyangiales bacterium]
MSHDIPGSAAEDAVESSDEDPHSSEGRQQSSGNSRIHTGVAPDDGPPSPGRGGDPEDFVFSQRAVRRYEIEVDPAEWEDLKKHAYLEQYIQARLKFEGTTYGPIGIRFKGFRGSLYSCFDFKADGSVTGPSCARMPLKLSFDEYDDDGRFFGLKKLNFHAMKNDSSLMRDRISYFVFRAFGVPAPRAVHALLTVNGEDQGLFALVEEIDGRFTRYAFDEGGEGNIYKERWPTISSDTDYFVSGLESNRDQPEVSGMQSFAEAVSGATDDTIEGVLREHTDFDTLMRYFAVDRAINHWDGPLAFRCRPQSEVPPLPPEVEAAQRPALGWEVCQNKNYYWYEETDSHRLSIVPWDMDVTWGSYSQFPDWNTAPTARACAIAQSGRPPRCDKLVNWLATTLRPHYERAGRELLTTGPLHPELLFTLADRWYQQILPYVDPVPTALGALLLNGAIDDRIRAFADEVTH